jgi:hypothetical protein
MSKETKMMWAVVIAIALGIGFLAYSNKADAAGFRENRSWQFDGPLKIAAKTQRESLRLLSDGGYFEGSHANKSIYIGEVNVDDVSGSLHYQTNTTVGNQTTVIQQGDGTLTYDGMQDSGAQGSTNDSQGNVVGAQNATEVNQSGTQSNTSGWVLNGGN